MMATETQNSTIFSQNQSSLSQNQSNPKQLNDNQVNSSETMMKSEQQSTEINKQTTIDENAQLIERNIKHIHIREESTIKKVLKTREVKHFNSYGELTDPPLVAQQNQNNDQTNEQNQEESEERQTNQNNLINNIQDNDDHLQTTSNHVINNFDNHNGNNNINNDIINPAYLPTLDSTDSGTLIHQDRNVSNNYQNLFINDSANFPNPISAQQNDAHQSTVHQPIPVQPIQRTSIRNTTVPPSGYEELDSTLCYPGQAHIQPNVIHQEPNASIYASINKKSILVQPPPSNTNIMVHENGLTEDKLSYMGQKSNYDLAYGANVPVSQVPISNTNKIYGTRVVQEPVYAINSNGTLTYVTQPINNNNTNISDGIRWRDPELEEVIAFLSSPDPTVRANSVAYLQHLTYADDQVKQKTRHLGGITLLIDLLNRDILEVQRNVCGALRNLSFGRKNDDNKRAIRDAQGIQALVRTLINNPDNEIREVATSVLWNLSSCEDIKWSIVDIALIPLVSVILVPYTSWFKANLNNSQQFLPIATETHWSTVFRNTTGVLRNISSAGAHARKQLRDCDRLVESLFFIINTSISRNEVENKLVENGVCILRNLSYRCQETQDPDYDKHYYSQNTSQTDSLTNSIHNSPSSPSSSANLTTSLVEQVSSKVGNNIGCFSFVKKSSKSKSKSSFLSLRNSNNSSNSANNQNESSSIQEISNNRSTLPPPHHASNLQPGSSSSMVRTSTQVDGFNNNVSSMLDPSGMSTITVGTQEAQGKDLLWQTDVVKPYLALLSGCSNSETLEAAAGAIQNLAACFWQPSIEIRAAVRKERGLPVLVELLRMDRDSVVCVVATALRNLAIDQKNKELIGKYAMLDLVNKLTTEQTENESPSSDDTIAAVLATLHEVISNNVDFVRSFYEVGGLIKLTYIVRNKSKFSLRVQRFAAQVSECNNRNNNNNSTMINLS